LTVCFAPIYVENDDRSVGGPPQTQELRNRMGSRTPIESSMPQPALPRDASTLAGSTVLVTGASGGIGEGIALAAGAAGANVVVAARRRDQGERVASEIVHGGARARFVTCDVTDRAQVDRAVDETVRSFGRLDAMVHNATSGRSNQASRLEDITESEWRDHEGVALTALLHCAQAAFDQLRQNQGALLVLTSSTAITGHATLPLYATMKGAQRGFVKSLAREWGVHGIRVNCLAPHPETPASARFGELDPAHRARDIARTSMRRLGDPTTDVGPVAAFFCGRGAGWVTGQTLFVDGGVFTGL
jgi:3-oxoacyl-[acyl-carrier protein] reductase